MIRKALIAALIVAALVSLGLAMASCFTYQITLIPYTPGVGDVSCTVIRGRIAVGQSLWVTGAPIPDTRIWFPGLFEFYGGEWEGFRVWSFDIHLWFAFVLFAAYPTMAIIRGPLARHRRRMRGACQKCGYDLTGNVSGRCPECGTALTPENGET